MLVFYGFRKKFYNFQISIAILIFQHFTLFVVNLLHHGRFLLAATAVRTSLSKIMWGGNLKFWFHCFIFRALILILTIFKRICAISYYLEIFPTFENFKILLILHWKNRILVAN